MVTNPDVSLKLPQLEKGATVVMFIFDTISLGTPWCCAIAPDGPV